MSGNKQQNSKHEVEIYDGNHTNIKLDKKSESNKGLELIMVAREFVEMFENTQDSDYAQQCKIALVF